MRRIFYIFLSSFVYFSHIFHQMIKFCIAGRIFNMYSVFFHPFHTHVLSNDCVLHCLTNIQYFFLLLLSIFVTCFIRRLDFALCDEYSIFLPFLFVHCTRMFQPKFGFCIVRWIFNIYSYFFRRFYSHVSSQDWVFSRIHETCGHEADMRFYLISLFNGISHHQIYLMLRPSF